MTDEHGRFSAILSSPEGELDAYATHAGFYENRSGLTRLYQRYAEVSDARERGHWEPWEKMMKIVLRPVKNPVPMYAMNVAAVIPVLNESIGFDLQQGDWVAPYGTGKKMDFEFFLDSGADKKSAFGLRLTLRVPGAANGIQTYDLRNANAPHLFYEAPTEGYQSECMWTFGEKGSSREKLIAAVDADYSRNHTRRFIFRVRSAVDAQNHLTDACYGKIYGPGELIPRPNGKWEVRFLYYLNPDKTRNLEFDPTRNLLSGQPKLPP